MKNERQKRRKKQKVGKRDDAKDQRERVMKGKKEKGIMYHSSIFFSLLFSLISLLSLSPSRYSSVSLPREEERERGRWGWKLRSEYNDESIRKESRQGLSFFPPFSFSFYFLSFSFGKNKDYDLPNGAEDFLFKRKRNGKERKREREKKRVRIVVLTSNENKY